jgi:CubicO group peptidase (beta-lactamase class C family)
MGQQHFAGQFAVLVLCCLLNAYCTDANAYEYAVPEMLNDGWETASLTSVNMDAALIRELCGQVINGGYKNIQSVLVVKEGKLVVEEYFPRQEGDRREQALKRVSPHEQHSATKSVNSILIGIAIDQHLIRSVDEKVSTFFPEYADIFKGDKDKLRLKDLLTMSAGLSWDEWTYPYTDPLNDHVAMIRSSDPIRYVLERPLVAPSGTRFTYSSGVAIMLGQIIRKVSGERTDKFAERHLFEPLGITDFYWMKYPDDIVQTGGGLYLRPRDMAKIGFLFLNGGRWQGKQIVSEAWVRESTKDHANPGQIPEAAHATGYGYQWWLSSFRVGDRVVESFSARGRGGQFILVIPERQLVLTFTSSTDDSLTFQPLEMAQRFILLAADVSRATRETKTP